MWLRLQDKQMLKPIYLPLRNLIINNSTIVHPPAFLFYPPFVCFRMKCIVTHFLYYTRYIIGITYYRTWYMYVHTTPSSLLSSHRKPRNKREFQESSPSPKSTKFSISKNISIKTCTTTTGRTYVRASQPAKITNNSTPERAYQAFRQLSRAFTA